MRWVSFRVECFGRIYAYTLTLLKFLQHTSNRDGVFGSSGCKVGVNPIPAVGLVPDVCAG